MLSTLIGFEAAALKNNGINYYFMVNHEMTIKGLQIDCSFAPLSPDVTGFAEIFAYGFLLEKEPQFPPGGKESFFTVPNDPAFLNGKVFPPKGIAFKGGGVYRGGLFGMILKEWMPRGCNKICCNKLGLKASIGNWIVFHADHMGAGPVDFELQAVLTYNPH